jgi:DNA-directed RNA polymerase specialized sigma24 family protein
VGGSDKPDGDPGLPPAPAGRRSRRDARAAAGAGRAAQSDAVAASLHSTYYEPLARLAALLTGDTAVAEEVTCDALVALCSNPGSASSPSTGQPPDAVVAYLQRQVIIRSRRARSYQRGLGGGDQLANSPVLRALQELRAGAREAVVLTLYLNLTEREAATAARVSPAALRRNLADGIRAMRTQLPD